MDRDESYEAWSASVDDGYAQQMQMEAELAPCPGVPPGYADCCRVEEGVVAGEVPF